MANTKLSDLGGREVDMTGGSPRLGALGDGTSKPGSIVYYVDATGYATFATTALFTGILDNDYKTADDTAITAASPVSIIIPQSGKKYRVFITDPGGAKVTGTMMTIANGTGCLTIVTDTTLAIVARLARPVANGDRYAEVIWA